MCAVVGLWSPGCVAQPLFSALAALQHRGQQGAGALLVDRGQRQHFTGAGLLPQALPLPRLESLPMQQGLGHLRYSTSGSARSNALQPLSGRADRSLYLVHNGNLTNIKSLREQVTASGPFVSDTDLLAQLLSEQITADLSPSALLESASRVLDRVEGGFACIAWLSGRLLAFRDPLGIRPLQLGRRAGECGVEWMLASESVAFEAAGFTFVRDLAPGELLLIDQAGALHSGTFSRRTRLTPSVFEYVYFASAASTLDGVCVQAVREELGYRLAGQLSLSSQVHSNAVVVPVPSTGCPAAQGLARALKLPYRVLLNKRAHSGRSFIMGNQLLRSAAVRDKFSLGCDDLHGQHLILVDDSIVRGTTLRYLVGLLRNAGASRITLCSTAPAVRYTDCYGIDLADSSELIASQRSDQEVAAVLGVDSLHYLPKQQLIDAVRQQNPAIEHFECALFDGNYVAGFQNRAEATRLLSAPTLSSPPETAGALPQAIPA